MQKNVEKIKDYSAWNIAAIMLVLILQHPITVILLPLMIIILIKAFYNSSRK